MTTAPTRNRTSAALAALIGLSVISGAALAGPPAGAHPRYLIGNLKAQLAADYAGKLPFVTLAVNDCAKQNGKVIGGGYQGYDWALQMAACAVAWHATGNAIYATQAVALWRAMLDDKLVAGDGLGGVGANPGGMFIACQDDGYSMRTFGAYSALALDWLHDAPGVDATLRAHAISRIDDWGNWYEHGDPRCTKVPGGGYHNNQPTANYFAGYFLATWAGAIAVGTDDATVGTRLWNRALALTDGLLKPALAGILVGGDQYEGWEYGELTTAAWALSSAAAAQNGYASFADQYLHDTIALHMYAIHPGGKTFLDSGDRNDHPVVPGSDSVWAALLHSPNDSYAPYGRKYLAGTGPGLLHWVSALAEAAAPQWKTADYANAGLPLSYLAKGTGMVLARSGWGAGDTWSMFTSASRMADDHQHNDAGHFELARGLDDLAISSADYGTYATWNNNTLLVDDGGAINRFPPQQEPFEKGGVVIRRYAELGMAAVAQADFGHAYDNANGVSPAPMARREWVFVRPDLLVVNDRVQVAAPTMKVTFPLHTALTPTVNGALLTVETGTSRLTSQTLLPGNQARGTVQEPTGGADPWTGNATYASPLYRAEESLVGQSAQGFLHVLTAGAKGVAAAGAQVADAGGAHVVTVAGNPARIIVVPAAADGSDIALPLHYTVPAGASTHVVLGLAAAGPYQASAVANGPNCLITVDVGADGNVASGDHAAGFSFGSCGVVAPLPDLAMTPPDLATPPGDMAIPVVPQDLAMAPRRDLASPPPPGADLAQPQAVDGAAPPAPGADLALMPAPPLGDDGGVNGDDSGAPPMNPPPGIPPGNPEGADLTMLRGVVDGGVPALPPAPTVDAGAPPVQGASDVQGGWSCSVAAGRGGSSDAMFSLLALALSLLIDRRRRRRA